MPEYCKAVWQWLFYDTCMLRLLTPWDDHVYKKYMMQVFISQRIITYYQYKNLPGATVNIPCHWWCCYYRTWVLMETQLAVCKMPSSNVLVHLTRRCYHSWTFCTLMVPRRVVQEPVVLVWSREMQSDV